MAENIETEKLPSNSNNYIVKIRTLHSKLHDLQTKLTNKLEELEIRKKELETKN